jgi:DNA-binding transcriptional regulator YiaG
MPTLAAALRLEVRRVARKETHRTLARLRRVQKQLRELRLASRLQRASVLSLKRRVRRLRDRLPLRGAGPVKSAPRIAPRAIRTLRARLRMTRVQFAELVGVSPGSIFGWETGRTMPRGGSRARLVELSRKRRASGAGARRGRGAGRRRRRAGR